MFLRRWTLLVVSLAPFALRAVEPAPPKLAVFIAVDQLRADYLVRFRPYFAEGGFKRLLEGGADFRNAHYRHAITHTGPGHALMLSGVYSNVHGIVGNEWIDRTTWESVNCVEDPGSPLVGINPAELGPTQAKAPQKTGRSPQNYLATTVSDVLKARYGEKCRVFAASGKDRGAILPGGHKADGAYWDENGRFVTSRYYRAELPAWVVAFNAEHPAAAHYGAVWDRLLAPEIYEKTQGPDAAPGELDGSGYTPVFPKKVTGGSAPNSHAFFVAYENSPFATVALGAFAERAVVEEKLGRHEGTDLLSVSFSQVDAIGHNYGPDSHEVMDSVLRLDRVLAALFATIDREVGLKNCVIVLTADHGVTPLPEHDSGVPSGRVKVTDLDAAVKKALDAKFGALAKGETWFARDNATYHLRPAAIAARATTAEAAAETVKRALLAVPQMGHAFTRAELVAAPIEGDSVLAMARRSFNPERPRDVLFFMKPNFMTKVAPGTSHGAPYEDDTHVPLVFWGQGVPAGVRTERVGVESLAPTLAGLLGVSLPPVANGKKLF
ncbi:MAG: alkaline phosphatase family protein [Verrucomicrobia bacterium]|nr:alkaline phosphatase family protein [Verrucomicrobiota bacterium]